MTGQSPNAGTYGLRLSGLPLGDAVPHGVPASWPHVTLSSKPAPAVSPAEIHDADRCVITLVDNDRRVLVADRAAATLEFHGPPIPLDEMAHPYLGPVATVFARWLGREAFHGGAFVCGDRAVAILGAKEAGKSTLVAALAAAGFPVIADDMLVVEDGAVFMGPRSVDLRSEPGLDLHGGATVSKARANTRWRVALGPVPHATPLGGWVFLTTGPEASVTPVGLSERLTRLARWRAWRDLPSDPAALLGLAGLPAWDLVAPRSWDALPATVATITGLLGRQPATA